MTQKSEKKYDEAEEVIQYIVDAETGEIVKLVYNGDKLKVISPSQHKAIDYAIKTKRLDEEIKEWNDFIGGFIFILFKYGDLYFSQFPEIIPQDIAKLFYLATFINYDGYLFLEEEDEFITRTRMKKMLDIGTAQFDIFFNKMKECNIFIQEKKKIKINTDFFLKGEVTKEIKDNFNFTRAYIYSIRYLFENTPKRSQGRLGLYFKLIPFMHRQQNVICWNPDEPVEQMKPMKVKDLKDKIGYHRNSIREFLKMLYSTKLENGEPIVGTFQTEYDRGEAYIIINPRVFYGGNFNLKGGKNAVLKWFKE